MLMNLLRLGRLTGRQELEGSASEPGGGLFRGGLPSSASTLGIPPRAGLRPGPGPGDRGRRKPGGRGHAKLLAALRRMYLPHAAVLFKPEDEPAAAQALERLVPFTKEMDAGGGRPPPTSAREGLVFAPSGPRPSCARP
ncbi:MAG: hypothetical protein M0C28_14965 [Candidatus Moduliflexus flocculans]|nr:hypothetical protein [Candidatus Moduliflexus flocculans]